MFDHMLESSESHQDYCNKWLKIGLGEEITHKVLIEVNFTCLSGTDRSSTKIILILNVTILNPFVPMKVLACSKIHLVR